MRMRRKRNLTLRMENCAHLLIPEPQDLRGQWKEAFGYGELHIELGCGKGRFIVEAAKNNPSILFVAVEKYSNVLVTACELAVRENVRNVRFINSIVENIAEFFAPNEVSQIYINFCDPWQSARHTKRRLTSGSFLKMYKEILRDSGVINFKTDNQPLFEFSKKEFENAGFSVCSDKNDIFCIITEYEQKFLDNGQPIYRCRYGKG